MLPATHAVRPPRLQAVQYSTEHSIVIKYKVLAMALTHAACCPCNTSTGWGVEGGGAEASNAACLNSPKGNYPAHVILCMLNCFLVHLQLLRTAVPQHALMHLPSCSSSVLCWSVLSALHHVMESRFTLQTTAASKSPSSTVRADILSFLRSSICFAIGAIR